MNQWRNRHLVKEKMRKKRKLRVMLPSVRVEAPNALVITPNVIMKLLTSLKMRNFQRKFNTML